MAGNLDIVTRLSNRNSIEICNNTKVGKGFIWFTGELKRAPYLVIDILSDRSIKTGQEKAVNLYYNIDSFSSTLVDSSVYSSIMGSSSETYSIQDLVDEVLPKSN